MRHKNRSSCALYLIITANLVADRWTLANLASEITSFALSMIPCDRYESSRCNYFLTDGYKWKPTVRFARIPKLIRSGGRPSNEITRSSDEAVTPLLPVDKSFAITQRTKRNNKSAPSAGEPGADGRKEERKEGRKEGRTG